MMTEKPQLPLVRRIESRNPDVSDQYAEEIQDAINRGVQVSSFTLTSDSYSAFADEPLKESCLTRFTDPRTGDERWAVEIWSVSNKWSRDYAHREHAEAYLIRQHDRLGI